KPDGIVPTLGGQTALNLAVELEKEGHLRKLGIRLLGCNVETISKAEDRKLFKELMVEINEPVPESAIVHNMEEALGFSEKIGFPLIIRPAFTLGGTGGGIALDQGNYEKLVHSGLTASPIHQCLIERSIAGYK